MCVQENVFVCIRPHMWCCPKLFLPAIATFTRKETLSRNFRGTIAVHVSDKRLIARERKKETERERERDTETDR